MVPLFFSFSCFAIFVKYMSCISYKQVLSVFNIPDPGWIFKTKM